MLIALAIGLLLIGQQTLIMPGNSRLGATVHDAMHVPWSAVITFLLWRLTDRWKYAVFIATLIGLATEGAQLFTGRNASLTDLTSDALGIALATALYALYRLKGWQPRLLAILAVLTITAHTVWPIAMVYASRNWLIKNDPVLFDASDLRGYFLADVTADSEYMDGTPPGLRMTITDRQWSGLHLRNLPKRKVARKQLILELTVEGQSPLRLGTNVYYWKTTEPGWKDHWLKPGYQKLVIPVKELDGRYQFRAGGHLYFYGYQEQAGRSFILHRVYLR